MRIVIAGATGRLGSTLKLELASAGHQVSALRRADLDVTDAAQVDYVVKRLRPQAIVNCSAYNAVDAAQADAPGAYALNAEGPANLARAARNAGALLVHYSTDFVFDGTAQEPYSEEDPTNPLSVYGASKLAGENEAQRADRHYVLRLESLFGGIGVRGHRATVDQIAEQMIAGNVVRALTDRTVSPSYVADVSRVSRILIERNAPSGVYHCVNSGFTTWYALAMEVSRELGVPATIVPLKASDFQTPAPRPQFCALSNRKLLALGIEMPTWRTALARHLAVRYGQPAADPLRANIA
jgi:dTDP-4-dehydrorhamnose reductase